MKRFLYILSLLPLGLTAQNMYNVVPLFENDLAGTARFVGMGGSMSALGADLSTMGTNPAGMAIYRLNDLSLTLGLDAKYNKATYLDEVTKSNSTSTMLDNFSFVFSSKRDGKNLKYLNFGLGYRQRNNLNSAFEMSGIADIYSQQYVMEQLYRNNKFDHNNLDGWMYDSFKHSWLTLLAAEAYLCDSTGTHFLTYPDTTLVWMPDDIAYYEKSTGGVNTVDFNISANFNDRIYLGATIGVSFVDPAPKFNTQEQQNNGNSSNEQQVVFNDRSTLLTQSGGVPFFVVGIAEVFGCFVIFFFLHTGITFTVVCNVEVSVFF